MKVPLSWLKDFVDITLPLDRLVERLTLGGLEVESVTQIGELWDRDKIFVGQVLEVGRHPEADRLVLARVDYGAGAPMTVVTGAPNLYPFVGQELAGRGPKVAFALTGARLVDGHSEERHVVRLKPSKIRGIPSEAMCCSEKELDLGDSHEGIILLPDDAPVGMPLMDYMGDTVLEFDIKGPFGHLQSVYGVARELAALTGQPLRADVMTILDRQPVSITPAADFTAIVIKDPDLCPRYSAALIEGVTVKPSPLWMQQRLQRAGQRPINNVVDITNYVMLELGQPLHAFDYDLLRERAGGRPAIIMRRAYEGEHLTTLDGVDRALDPDMLMITDTAGTIAVGGVMGGANTEVNDGTTAVLLEAANFNFLSIRRTTQILRLSSEAGSRFGKGVDPELTVEALARAGQLLEELAGGTVRPVYGDCYPGKPAPRSIDLDPAYVDRLLGVEIPVDEMVRILRALEFEMIDSGGAEGRRGGGDPSLPCPSAPPLLCVVVPSHRLDVSIPADLAEEIGRVYGYDRLPVTLLQDELPPQRRNVALEGEETVRNILAGAGLDEVIAYSMIDLADEARLVPTDRRGEAFHAEPTAGSGLASGAQQTAAVSIAGNASPLPAPRSHVTVLNPLSADRAHLRRTLLPGLLNTARANLRFLDRVAIFEVGRVYVPRPGATLPAEPRRLGALLVGPREASTWLAHDAGPLGFFDLKGIVEDLVARLSLPKVTWERGEHPAMHPGRTARLLVDGAEAGFAGELHPLVRAAFDLPDTPVAVMELDLDALLAPWGAAMPMTELSAQPAVYEDLALIVDEGTPAVQVVELIRQSGGKLLVDARLFDVYRGQQIPAGKKSLAYALTFQAPDRTLSDEDAKKLRQKIVARLERELGAVLRA
jgi:phenylalanyl-tRNA synthetase beta chain